MAHRAALRARSFLRALACGAHVVDEVRIRPSGLLRTALRRGLLGRRQMMGRLAVLLLGVAPIPRRFSSWPWQLHRTGDTLRARSNRWQAKCRALCATAKTCQIGGRTQ